MRRALADMTGKSVHVATAGTSILVQIRQSLAHEVRNQTAQMSLEQALEFSDAIERAIAEQRAAAEVAA